MDDLETLARRVTQLERRLRRYRAIAVLAAVAGFGSLVLSSPSLGRADGEKVETLKARRFEIVDAQGKPCVTLGASDEGRGLSISRPNGDVCVQLRLARRDRGLVVLDDDGKARFMAGISDEVGPGLMLMDGNEKLRAHLSVTKHGAGLTFLGTDGEPAAWVQDWGEGEAGQAGGPNLMLSRGGKVTLSAIPRGGALTIADDSGQNRAALVVGDKTTALQLKDHRGKGFFSQAR